MKDSIHVIPSEGGLLIGFVDERIDKIGFLLNRSDYIILIEPVYDDVYNENFWRSKRIIVKKDGKWGALGATLEQENFQVDVAPNIVTMLALCAGVTSIRYSIQEDWAKAVFCVFIAALFDGLDGRVARMLKGSTKFGAELVQDGQGATLELSLGYFGNRDLSAMQEEVHAALCSISKIYKALEEGLLREKMTFEAMGDTISPSAAKRTIRVVTR